MLDALQVRAKARVGAVVGVVVGVLAYVLFVVVRGQPADLAALYVVSLFVVAASTAVIVTVALVTRRLLRATIAVRRWIRRAATLGAGGGAVLALLATLGPALSVTVGDRVLPLYGTLLPLGGAGLLAGVWSLHAAHRPRAAYGSLGRAGWFVAAPSALLTWWVVAVEEAAVLGGPTVGVSSRALLVVLLTLSLGTSLLGAAALRVRAIPSAGALAALFALPVSLGGLTAALVLDGGSGLVGAYLDPASPSTVALLVPVGVAWTLVCRDLRAGRGVPPASAFGIDLVADGDAAGSDHPPADDGDGGERGRVPDAEPE